VGTQLAIQRDWRRGTETFSNTGPTTLTSTAVFNDTLLPSNAQEAGGGGVSSVFTILAIRTGFGKVVFSIPKRAGYLDARRRSALYLNAAGTL